MKPLLLGCALTCILATGCLADQRYWVIGNRAAGKCQIVTSNPTVTGAGSATGKIWLSDGPYRSLDDAKLARSTIRVCPNRFDPSDQ